MLLLVTLLSGATSCGAGTVRGIVKIGLVAPLGGSDVATGQQMLQAARLAVREWNARGVLAGYRVALQSEDDRDAATEGEQRARALAIDPAIIGVVGHITAESAEPSAQHYADARLALVTFGNVTAWSQLGGADTVFSLTSSPQTIARAARDLVTGRLKAKTVVLVHEPGPANEALVQLITQELRSAGATSVRRVVVAVTQSRYDEAAQGIAEIHPDAVILATNYVTAGEIAAKLRPLSATPIVLAAQAERPDILRIAHDSVRGSYSLAIGPYPAGEGASQPFVSDYKQLADVGPTDYAALTYDATSLLIEVARRQVQREGRIDRVGVLRELGNGMTLDGVTGAISFDEQRTRRDSRMYTYQLTGATYPGELINK